MCVLVVEDWKSFGSFGVNMPRLARSTGYEIDEQLNLALALSASEAEQSKGGDNLGARGEVGNLVPQVDADAMLAWRLQREQEVEAKAQQEADWMKCQGGAQPSFVSGICVGFSGLC